MYKNRQESVRLVLPMPATVNVSVEPTTLISTLLNDCEYMSPYTKTSSVNSVLPLKKVTSSSSKFGIGTPPVSYTHLRAHETV